MLAGRYRLLRMLGAGGMGVVYEVEDCKQGERLALKLMARPNLQRLVRFKQEFRAIARLYHPNLIRYHDLVCEEKLWFYTMELVEGSNLLQVLFDGQESFETISSCYEENAWPEPENMLVGAEQLGAFEQTSAPVASTPRLVTRPMVCSWDVFRSTVSQILDALEFLHGHGIVHRDLKPTNILLDTRGRVCLLDFGLAKQSNGDLSMSQDDSLLGTLRYMSPEQVTGDPVSPASDLYSLGCILFQLLSGRLPFVGNRMQILQGHQLREPPLLSSLVTDIPPAIEAICRRLLEKDPGRRPNIAEVRAALQLPADTIIRATDHNTSAVTCFVGRDREQKQLEDCLMRTLSGRPQVAMLCGPSGRGKSTLATKFLQYAHEQGCSVFTGSCYEREFIPYTFFDSIMDKLVLYLRKWPAAFLTELQPALEAAGHLFPVLNILRQGQQKQTGALIPQQETLQEQDPIEVQQRRQHAFAGICELLTRLQAKVPLLLFIDDLHWVDQESMELLQALYAGVDGRVMFLGAFRSEEVHLKHPLQQMLQDSDPMGFCECTLEPLSDRHVQQLLETVAGESWATESAYDLAAQCRGEPFFATQLALLLHQQEDRKPVYKDEGFPQLQQLVKQRLQKLSAPAHQVLALTASAAGSVPFEVLWQASSLDFNPFHDALCELLAARFLRTVVPHTNHTTDTTAHKLASDKASTQAESQYAPEVQEVDDNASRSTLDSLLTQRRWYYDTYHDQFRTLLYEGLAPSHRRRLHRALAEALETTSAEISGHVDQLYYHWQSAENNEKSYFYLQRALAEAVAKMSYHRAIRLYHTFLQREEQTTNPQTHAAHWERLGLFYEYIGDLTGAITAQTRSLDLLQEVDRNQSTSQLIRLRSRLADNLISTGQFRRGLTHFREQLKDLKLPLFQPLRRALFTCLGLRFKALLSALLPDRWQSFRRPPHCEEKLVFFHTLSRLSMPLWPLVSAEASLRADLLARKLQNHERTLHGMVLEAFITIFCSNANQRQRNASRRRLQRAEQLVQRYQLPFSAEMVQFGMAILSLPEDLGQTKQALSSILEAFQNKGVTGSHEFIMARSIYFIALYIRGDYQELQQEVEADKHSKVANFLHNMISAILCTDVLCKQGKYDEAAEALQTHTAQLSDLPHVSILYLSHLAQEALLKSIRGDAITALHQMEAIEGELKQFGCFLSRWSWSYWFKTYMEIALPLYQQHALPPKYRKRLYHIASQLDRRAILQYRSTGPRLLALLYHQDGRTQQAQKALQRALQRSQEYGAPYERWQCLEAARTIGTITPEQQAEAATLVQRYGYTAFIPGSAAAS